MTDFVAPGDFSDLGIRFADVEPDVSIDGPAGEKLIMKPSGMYYTRDLFPNDSYRVAAKKISDAFFSWRKVSGLANLPTHKDISFNVPSYKEHSSKTITFGANGVRHDYEEIDTWMYWFLDALNEHIKSNW